MGGNSHDGTGAVFRQNKVAKPNRYSFARKRIDGVRTGKNTLFFVGIGLTGDFIHITDFGDEGAKFSFVFNTGNKAVHNWMFRSQSHKRNTENRIGAGCENFDFAFSVFQFENGFSAY